MPDLVIISGGQTGADQGGWRAARGAGVATGGIATGGMMPLGYLTEGGRRPEFAELFGAVEMPTPDYRARTEENVRRSEASLWFGSVETPGAKATLNAWRGMGRPFLVVAPGRGVKPSDVAGWVRAGGFKVLNVAGNRESKAPGIGAKVERFMAEVFRRLDNPPAL